MSNVTNRSYRSVLSTRICTTPIGSGGSAPRGLSEADQAGGWSFALDVVLDAEFGGQLPNLVGQDPADHHRVCLKAGGPEGFGPAPGPGDVARIDDQRGFDDDDSIGKVLRPPEQIRQVRVGLVVRDNPGPGEGLINPVRNFRPDFGTAAPARSEQDIGLQSNLPLVTFAFPPTDFTIQALFGPDLGFGQLRERPLRGGRGALRFGSGLQ